jgi:hypothetical protein
MCSAAHAASSPASATAFKSIISTATHIAWMLMATASAATAGDDNAPATSLWPAPTAGQPKRSGYSTRASSPMARPRIPRSTSV